MGTRSSKQRRALTLKAGKLASAFGSFPLRYDDARNWLIDLPQSYGYYYDPITVNGLPGAEADLAIGKLDARLQLTNSSPSNPRRLWQSDQYANWTAGAGYTLRQGLRVGISAVRGPYLDRRYPFYFPGEDLPKRLPATGYGTDLQWGHGRWNANAEAQQFRSTYHAIPEFRTTIAYGEARFQWNPRLYLATRISGRWRSAGIGADQSFEFAAGVRPGANQLVKLSYEAVRGKFIPGTRDNVLAMQYVFTLSPPTIARD